MLVVARHGRTAWNAEGRFQGWADVPLDRVGRDQAEALAEELASQLTISASAPVQLWSSDQLRARQTAEVVGRAIGASGRVERVLREVDVGRWEGLTRNEVRARFPGEYRAWFGGGGQARELRRGGGETLAEAGRRVAEFIAGRLTDRATLVVVGHGMSLQAGLDDLGRRGRIRLSGPAPHLPNAGYLALDSWGPASCDEEPGVDPSVGLTRA
ncbi:MAG: histidine phosphatase family protein [Acidobacteriota bacterium]|nr:histidine phosphatase family protein [Acidobacteriota bacterium]